MGHLADDTSDPMERKRREYARALGVEPTSQEPEVDPLPEDAALTGVMREYPGRLDPVHVGIDVGQVNDPTTYAIVQLVQRRTGRVRAVPFQDAQYLLRDGVYLEWIGSGYFQPDTETVYVVRQLKRIDTGTAYAQVERRLADMVCSPKLGVRTRRVFIDRTGVGRAVAEHLRDELLERPEVKATRFNLSIQPITFTSSDHYDPDTGNMGKPFLASRLDVLASTPERGRERIIIPEGLEHREGVYKELQDYSRKVSQGGHAVYGALEAGQFDDLVTALGLACLEDPGDGEQGYTLFHAPGYS